MSTPTADFRPAKLNLKHRRGDTVAVPFTINEAGDPADITGRTYRAQLRRTASTTADVPFDVDVVDPDAGQLVIRLSSDVTIDLSGTYAWDLEQTNGDVVRTLVAGSWLFDPDVTR